MDTIICHWKAPAARLRVTGADAATFLQGQFSAELRRSESSPATYGLWLNHKGRALADSHVLQHGPESFEVVSVHSRAEVIYARLEAYIIADDVAIEDVTAGLQGVIVAGPGADAAVRTLLGRDPRSRTFVADGMLTAIPARCDRGTTWMVYFGQEALADVRRRVADLGAREVGAEVIDRMRLAAGIPIVPDELGPEDLPMEGGLDLDAISFTKGCYLGQEVMARLHNLGQVRRRLFVVEEVADAGGLARGVPLFSGTQKVGELRAWVRGGEGTGGGVGLAMLQTHAAQPGQVLSTLAAGDACLRVRQVAEGRSA